MTRRTKDTPEPVTRPRVDWQHFEPGDKVRVGGLPGRHIYLGAFEDAGGTVVVVREKNGASPRYVNPELREVVDHDGRFTWRVRDGVLEGTEYDDTPS